jgi:hypothetical protein
MEGSDTAATEMAEATCCPSSPSFAQASLWDGCVERSYQEAEDRALRLASENEQSRKDLIDKLQQVLPTKQKMHTLRNLIVTFR